jgi:AcrR family transcriptional regulator
VQDHTVGLNLKYNLETVKSRLVTRMSPRPRKATDEQVFAAAQRLMGRLGPSELTLAAIAEEAGVTPGALVQRFGSRRELQLALAERVADKTPDLFADLRARHREPLAAIRAYANCYAGMGESPAAVARNLAYLLQDLTDNDLNTRVRAQARRTRNGLRALVRDAVNAGSLKQDTDVRALARIIEAVLGGSLLAWAFYHEGPAGRWLARDLEEILRPHVAEPPRHVPRVRPKPARHIRSVSTGRARTIRA